MSQPVTSTTSNAPGAAGQPAVSERYARLLAATDDVVGPECPDERTLAYRRRLLRAMIDVMAEVGYANTSVTEINRRALVSHRTFYEHFASKEEAFLTAYKAGNALVMKSVLAEFTPGRPWAERLIAGMTAYIDSILWHPPASWVFLREPRSMGGAVAELHHEVMRGWFDLVQEQVKYALAADPELARRGTTIDDHLSTGIVHGLEAIILEAIRTGATRADILRPCVILLCGPVQADVHAFGGLLRRDEGRSDLLRRLRVFG